MKKKRNLMIGAGGMAGAWIRRFYPGFADRVEVIGLVDINQEVLRQQGDFLGLPQAALFTDLEAAFAQTRADYCTIVTPPWVHRQCVELACKHGLHILMEKPIADTWKDVIGVYRAVRRARVKCTVIQNYRYEATMYTFRELLRRKRLGRLNYLMGRFAADYRRYGAWGAFRHEIPHSLLVEGGVHHLDMLRNLADSRCVEIAGWEWNRPWSSFKGESSASYVMRMDNGVVAHYEGTCSAAGHQNNWHQEYYRAECEQGEIVVDNDNVVRLVMRDNDSGAMTTTEVPLVRPQYEGHSYIIDAHLKWLGGGPKPETTLEDNIHSNAAMFAAIEASQKNKTVNVTALVEKVLKIGK